MTADPTLFCSKCNTEIKITESLAAPLIASIQQDYEDRRARKDADINMRETALREKEAAVLKAKKSVDAQVADKLTQERSCIAAEEAQKARRVLDNDLNQKSREIIIKRVWEVENEF